MKFVLVVLLSLVPIALVPTAAAAPCAQVTEPALGTSPVYVLPASIEAQVWTEWNGVAGLQRVACEDSTGRRLPADSYWITIGPGTAAEVVREVEEATGCEIGVPVRCFV